ncbi:MAG: hypothetical protein ACE5F6_22470, partial [Anaerolineae bacterium]
EDDGRYRRLDCPFTRDTGLNEDFGTLEWPTGADIDPTVLHDWPEHVDSIIERRRKQFAIPA